MEENICKHCGNDNFFCEECRGTKALRKKLVKETEAEHKNWKSVLNAIPKDFIPNYIYFVKQYVSSLDSKSQVVCYHFMTGIPKNKTIAFLNMSEKQLNRLLENVSKNAVRFLDEEENIFDKNTHHYRAFYELLLDPDTEDEDLARGFKTDMATIRIVRAFALQAKDM